MLVKKIGKLSPNFTLFHKYPNLMLRSINSSESWFGHRKKVVKACLKIREKEKIALKASENVFGKIIE